MPLEPYSKHTIHVLPVNKNSDSAYMKKFVVVVRPRNPILKKQISGILRTIDGHIQLFSDEESAYKAACKRYSQRRFILVSNV